MPEKIHVYQLKVGPLGMGWKPYLLYTHISLYFYRKGFIKVFEICIGLV